MLASDWTNRFHTLDVSNDGEVSPLDVLQVINRVNEFGPIELPAIKPASENFVDTNQDGFQSPVDALIVINLLIGANELEYIPLRESHGFVTSGVLPIELGQESGTRTLRVEVRTDFDNTDTTVSVEDQLLLYVVDPTDHSITLLDRGVPGSAILSVGADKTEMLPGTVRIDGNFVDIDLSALSDLSEGRLMAQLLDSDQDDGGKAFVKIVSNSVGPDSVTSPAFSMRHDIRAIGEQVDIDALTEASNVQVRAENVRYDTAAGRYTAEIFLDNRAGQRGRTAAIVFEGLPEGVTLANASGVTTEGDPYVNMQPTIGFGGLGTNSRSGRVEVSFENPNNVGFQLTPSVRFGPNNRSPIFETIGDLIATPGEDLSVSLEAADPDGDPVTFTLTPGSAMPTLQLRGNGTLLLKPKPDELGDYSFVVHASDGKLKSSQTVKVSIVGDPDPSTRITGRVLDVNNEPLAGVPIEVGRFQTATEADGSFQLELPSFTVPTEEFDILVPTGDPQFDPFSAGNKTIPLDRAGYDVTTGTSTSNPRQHPNLVTSFIDGSVVYGSDFNRSSAIRRMDGSGKLKTSAGELLPLNDTATFPDGVLENENNSQRDPATLFVAGDVRANENPALASLHTVLVREHNRRVDELAQADSQLSGEQLYQQGRRWVTALLQHITYNEFLPLLLGAGALPAYGGYDETVDPSISAMFSGAAFRFGHSMAIPELALLDETDTQLDNSPLSLRDAFFNPDPLKDDGIEPILRGMASQQLEELDSLVIDDLRNFLFGPPGAGGMDLVSLNIQRGRDLGLPSFNDARRALGLQPKTSLLSISSDARVRANLSATYSDTEAIDLWVGGLAENHLAGALVGETFWTIIRDQFQRLRDGDRFWFENEQFEAADLAAIRGTTLSSLIMQNSSIESLPASVFTSQTAPNGFGSGGSAATTTPTEFHSIDGSGNNETMPELGRAGSNLLTNYAPDYADGISDPAGADRPSARAVSNAVFAHDSSVPNAAGATHMFAIWGQLLTHDTNLTPGGTDNTLRIHGEAVTGDEAYPFVAEKLPLVLEHEVYIGMNNVIDRPIFLPALDISGGTEIDPGQSTMVMQEIATGETASVFVAAGSLQNREGTMFEGTLSITEVPPNLTPAALPENQFPDTVVTIQPGDMIFTSPAPISLPNRGGWEPGTVMDLWSINPVTGEFDNVGTGEVSPDGMMVNTVSGGVRNSSWHFFGPPPTSPNGPDGPPGCRGCKASAGFSSDVLLHSGAVVETHDLAGYQSQGILRTQQLTYNSLRADPRPIVEFGFDDVPGIAGGGGNRFRMIANLIVRQGTYQSELPGFPGEGGEGQVVFGLNGGEHFWELPADGGDIRAALQADLRSQPSGLYEYTVNAGLRRFNDTMFTGSSAPLTGRIANVNLIDGPFGSGWSLAGWQEIIEDVDGALLLIDGDGTELLYEPQTEGSNAFNPPPGDFSRVERQPDRTFHRTLTDRTVYEFNDENKLAVIRDRNGNETRYEYDGNGRLQRIVDPVGLATVFAYTNGRVTSMTDPSNRTTTLEYDSDGNLIRITDPDNTTRHFEYDSDHHMIAETDKRGNREQAFYDFAGRASHAILKDGSTVRVNPVEVQYLLRPDQTDDPFASPPVFHFGPAASTTSDPAGNVLQTQLDAAGQLVSSLDAEGPLPSVSRDENNLVTSRTDGRGNVTTYTWDDKGNLTSIADVVSAPPADLLADELIGYWPFDGIGQDYSGNNRHLDLQGEVGFAAGVTEDALNPQGNAAQFARRSTDDDAFDFGGGDFAIQAWVNFSDTSGEQILLEKWTGSTGPGWSLSWNAPAQANRLSLFGTAIQSVPLSPETDVWHHILVQVENGEGTMYFDGQMVADVPNAGVISDTATPMLIGERDGGQSFPLKGRIDEVAIWSRALIDVEIAALSDQSASVRNAVNQTILPAWTTGRLGNAIAIDGVDDYVHIGDLGDRPETGTISFWVNAEVVEDFRNAFTTGPINPDGTAGNRGIRFETLDTGQFVAVLGNDSAGNQAGTTVHVLADPLTTNEWHHVALAWDSGNDRVVGYLDGEQAFDAVNTTWPSTFPNVTVGLGWASHDTRPRYWKGMIDDVRIWNEMRMKAQIQTDMNQELSGNEPGLIGYWRFNEQRGYTAADSSAGSNSGILTNVDSQAHPPERTPGQLGNAIAFDGVDDYVQIDHSETLNTPDDVTIEFWAKRSDPFGIDIVLEKGGDWNLDDPNYGIGLHEINNNMFYFFFDGGWKGTSGVSDTNWHHYAVVASHGATTAQFFIDGNPAAVEFSEGSDVINLNTSTSPLHLGAQAEGAANYFSRLTLDDVRIWNTPRSQSDIQSSMATELDGSEPGLAGYWQFNEQEGFTAFDATPASSDGRLINFETSGSTVVKKFTYDPNFNQLTGITDELGRQTLFEVDPANGNRLSEIRVVGLPDATSGESNDIVTTFTYTAAGLVDTVTDPLGRVTDNDYDALGRLTMTTFAVGTSDEASRRFEYDAAGNIAASIDENGNRTAFVYDALNRLTRLTEADPDGTGPLTSPVTEFEYDANGNLTRTTDPRNNTTRNEYDVLDRLFMSLDPAGGTTRFDYDAAGNLASILDPLGNETRNIYDARDRLVETIDPNGGRTTFDYDVDNNLEAITDPVGNTTRFAYDSRNRQVREIDPLGNEITYEYDSVDNLTSQTDRNGRVRAYEYDELDRRIDEHWIEADGSTTNKIQYDYDDAGNLIQFVDNFSSQTFNYDARNRVVTSDNNGTPNAPNVVLSYTYDGVGNVLSVTDAHGGSDTATTQYTYDDLNRMARITQTGIGVSDKRVDFTYNPLGQYDSIERFSDLAGTQSVVATSYAYDTLNRLTDLRHNNGATDVAFYEYEYDPAGRIMQQINVDGTMDYAYDDRGQLTAVNHSSPANPDEAYEYDANGNRVNSHQHGSGYVTGPANRLQSDGTYDYEYDAEGNMIRRTEVATGAYREFDYDHRQRLISVIDRDSSDVAQQQVAFTYDAFDRRISRSVDGAVTHFVYDRDDVILDFADPDGIGGAVPALERRYLHGPDVDQVLAHEDASSQIAWYLTDHLGTPRDLVDNTGGLLHHYVFDTFGTLIEQTNATFETRYLFTGREYDDSLALYYYRARYYAAETGRFISEDPIGFSGNDANLYRYVFNVATVLSDPSGHNSENGIIFPPGTPTLPPDPILGDEVPPDCNVNAGNPTPGRPPASDPNEDLMEGGSTPIQPPVDRDPIDPDAASKLEEWRKKLDKLRKKLGSSDRPLLDGLRPLPPGTRVNRKPSDYRNRGGTRM